MKDIKSGGRYPARERGKMYVLILVEQGEIASVRQFRDHDSWDAAIATAEAAGWIELQTDAGVSGLAIYVDG